MKRTVSIAPMMKCTDRHGRYLLRLISPHVDLYTEMLTPSAIIYGDRERLLDFDVMEHPLGLQLGGSDPQQLAIAARMVQDWGYDEINLNVGCPSNRVRSGQFGACLFKQPEQVAECVAAMKTATSLPVTVKTRIGVDDIDSYDDLYHFVETVAQAGCVVFIIHARKAWLSGLNPKENRTVPPLCYERVVTLKRDFPFLIFIMNGSIKTVADVQQHLATVDGVMIGREAYADPMILATIEYEIFNAAPQSRQAVLAQYVQYMESQYVKGAPMGKLLKPVLGLFRGVAGGRRIRGLLTSHGYNYSDPTFIFNLLATCLFS